MMKTRGPNPLHPGTTPAQRRVLGAIGRGNHSPFMSNETCAAMLSAGLIAELPSRTDKWLGGVTTTIRQFEMSVHVHMAWCRAVVAECEGEDL